MNDGSRRAVVSLGLIATGEILRVVDATQSAVIFPRPKIGVYRTAGRQILRDRDPLVTRSKNIHQSLDGFALIHRAVVTTTLGRRD
jgi:hypothetical protein